MGPFEIAPGTQRDDGRAWKHEMFPPENVWPRFAERGARKFPQMGDISCRSALTVHRGTTHRSPIARLPEPVHSDNVGAVRAVIAWLRRQRPNMRPKITRQFMQVVAYMLSPMRYRIDERGQEVEYYRYDRLQAPVHLDAADFNPDKVWAPQPRRPAGPNGRDSATGASGR